MSIEEIDPKFHLVFQQVLCFNYILFFQWSFWFS